MKPKMKPDLDYKEMWLRLRQQLERDWDSGHLIKSGRALSLMDEFEKADWSHPDKDVNHQGWMEKNEENPSHSYQG